MKQVVQNLKDGSISVPEVPAPALPAGGLLVRTACSILSSGTEGARTRLARESLLGKARKRPDLVRQVLDGVRRDGLRATLDKVRDRLDQPKAPGYSLAGRVLAVGADVAGFRVGDRVACAGEGFASHAEIVAVPRNLVARVPDGVTPEEAAFTTLGAIALHGVRQTEARLGETVVVIGLGLVGQLAWQLVAAAGARPLGVDPSPAALNQARLLGLEEAFGSAEAAEARLAEITGGLGADAVLITAGAGDAGPIVAAGRLCRDRGRVVVLGDVPMDIPRSPFYEKEIEIRLSRSYGPGRYDAEYEERGLDYPAGYVRWTENRNMQAFLDLAAAGRLRLRELIVLRLPVAEAAAAYQRLSGPERVAGAIALEYPPAGGSAWPDAEVSATRDDAVVALRPAVAAAGGRQALRIGFIGAGHFARSVLLPVVRAHPGVTLSGVATAHAHTAEHVARRQGFDFATTDPERLLDDPGTGAVFIATRHDSHARLAAAALRRGKAVFVEKPLGLTQAEVDDVLAAQRDSGALLCVGFNRRFAPLVQQLRRALPAGSPRHIHIRVNAGPLPAGHWLLDPKIGGGRLIGEGCHFVDLALYLGGSQVATSHVAGDGQDFSVQISFADGGMASVLYTGAGSAPLAKERVEVFCGGTACVLDDFRTLEVFSAGRRTRQGGRRQDKGHRQLVQAFLQALGTSTTGPIPPCEMAAVQRILTRSG